jgi:hypothetical protein
MNGMQKPQRLTLLGVGEPAPWFKSRTRLTMADAEPAQHGASEDVS